MATARSRNRCIPAPTRVAGYTAGTSLPLAISAAGGVQTAAHQRTVHLLERDNGTGRAATAGKDVDEAAVLREQHVAEIAAVQGLQHDGAGEQRHNDNNKHRIHCHYGQKALVEFYRAEKRAMARRKTSTRRASESWTPNSDR